MKKQNIFIIEKGWINSSVEKEWEELKIDGYYPYNKRVDGYYPFGYKLTKKEAKEFCEQQGYWTEKDCWTIQYHPNKIMWKYRYREIEYCE